MQLHFQQVFSVCSWQETHPLPIDLENTNYHEVADSGFYQPTFFWGVQKQHPQHIQFYHFPGEKPKLWYGDGMQLQANLRTCWTNIPSIQITTQILEMAQFVSHIPTEHVRNLTILVIVISLLPLEQSTFVTSTSLIFLACRHGHNKLFIMLPGLPLERNWKVIIKE